MCFPYRWASVPSLFRFIFIAESKKSFIITIRRRVRMARSEMREVYDLRLPGAHCGDVDDYFTELVFLSALVDCTSA